MKRPRDEQESSESDSRQDPLQPPLKVPRFTENEKAEEVSARALYPSFYDGLVKELSSEASESSSETFGELSSVSSSDSSGLQEMATRLDKIRRKLLHGDRRIQRTVMMLSTYAAAEDNLDMTALLLLLARKVVRLNCDLDLEMIVDGMELAAEEHKELQARAKQEERTIQGSEEARVSSGPADILELCRMHQDAQAAMEEAERWAGLLTATEEQGQIANRRLQERVFGVEKERNQYKKDLLHLEEKNLQLEAEVARLRAAVDAQGASLHFACYADFPDFDSRIVILRSVAVEHKRDADTGFST